MRIRSLLLAILAVAAVAGLIALVLLIRGLELGDEQQIRASLRDLERVDAQFDLEIASSRLVVDVERDALFQLLEELRERMDGIAAGQSPIAGITPEIDEALVTYLGEMQAKISLAQDFERRNLRLVNALQLIPQVSNNALAALPAEDEPGAKPRPSAEPSYSEARNLINRFNKEVLAYGMLPDPQNEPVLQDLLYTMSQPQIPLPDAEDNSFRFSFRRLSSLGGAVLVDKNAVDESLINLFELPTDTRLDEVQSAYDNYREGRLDAAQNYRYALLVYAALLLLSLAWLGLRLRASYRRLDTANDGLRDANENLEARVADRTENLERTLADLKSSQAQLVQSEKMASLGQMVAGVSHEINTPLGYVRSNNDIVSQSLQELEALLAAYQETLRLLEDSNADETALATAFAELEQLTAELEPEVLLGELQQLVGDNEDGLVQISELVSNLKDFSRLDRSRTEHVNLNTSLDAAVNICRSQLKDKVEVVRDYGDLPEIECAPSQINQVFLNLITNAGQAMEDAGRIQLITRRQDDNVLVRIRDNGKGMDKETSAKIFDPFFTTKPPGQGTGLGLSIVYRIIKEHAGRIVAASLPGKGTEFAILLPLRQPKQVLKDSQNEGDSGNGFTTQEGASA